MKYDSMIHELRAFTRYCPEGMHFESECEGCSWLPMCRMSYTPNAIADALQEMQDFFEWKDRAKGEFPEKGRVLMTCNPDCCNLQFAWVREDNEFTTDGHNAFYSRYWKYANPTPDVEMRGPTDSVEE